MHDSSCPCAAHNYHGMLSSPICVFRIWDTASGQTSMVLEDDVAKQRLAAMVQGWEQQLCKPKGRGAAAVAAAQQQQQVSPVCDKDGRVVELQTSGSQSTCATIYMLPPFRTSNRRMCMSLPAKRLAAFTLGDNCMLTYELNI